MAKDNGMIDSDNLTGTLTSPGGFIFGVQGWTYGEPVPKSITFFLDNTAKVCDKWGRAIKGTVIDNKEIYFAPGPPSGEDTPETRKRFANHVQVIAALKAEQIDWTKLVWAGWPQIPYAELKKLSNLPPTPIEELRKIKDNSLRKDALRARREVDEIIAKEAQAIEAE